MESDIDKMFSKLQNEQKQINRGQTKISMPLSQVPEIIQD